jgi:hypothetical protein
VNTGGKNMPTVGLFGTCGKSKWRTPFMEKYKELGICFYNPQVENWDPSCADIEAQHLADDEVILFPVTNETYATGSLSEVGFSILQAIRLDDRRDFIVLVASDLLEELNDSIARKESLRARALVKQHLKKLRLPNLYLVDTLDEMLQVSIELYRTAQIREPLARFNPHKRNKL